MLPRVRWNDEDWWLERRLFSWPPMFQKAGRDLFHKQDAWSQLPPWSPCRENCTRLLSRDYRVTTVIRLGDSWQCRWNESHDTRDWVAGRRWGAPCTNLRAGFEIVTRLAHAPGAHAFMAGEEARFP